MVPVEDGKVIVVQLKGVQGVTVYVVEVKRS